jgi:hypothetical protein
VDATMESTTISSVVRAEAALLERGRRQPTRQ